MMSLGQKEQLLYETTKKNFDFLTVHTQKKLLLSHFLAGLT